MSRIASYPVTIPQGVSLTLNATSISAKGPKGELSFALNPLVKVEQKDNQIEFAPVDDTTRADAMSGTIRALVANLVQGVNENFVKKLELRGVGYRAQVQGSTIQLSLGFSHPVKYNLPKGISAVAPSQTELHIVGVDKQQVGQVAAEIRSLRPPEAYKGKGVRYTNERVVLKETKKK